MPYTVIARFTEHEIVRSILIEHIPYITRGAIRCLDLAEVAETDIVENLRHQHVALVRRIKIKMSNR